MLHVITMNSEYKLISGLWFWFPDIAFYISTSFLIGNRPGGGSWLSVSQGIGEDTSDLVSGFATIGDGLSESIDYPNEYWDSDEYEDDDDVGYMRQPIEDETWFLAHEIDYPSDNEKGTGVPDSQEREQNKDDEDEQSFAEDDSYFSGERYIQSNVDRVASSDNHVGQLMDEEEELNLMRGEPVWQGFVPQTNELFMLDEKVTRDERSRIDDICTDDDQHDSVRSIGVGINSDAADIGSEVRESLVGGSSEGDIDYFRDHHELDKNRGERSKSDKNRTKGHNGKYTQAKNQMDGGFSFPPPKDGRLVQASSSKSLWSNKANTDSSPVNSSRDEKYGNDEESANSSPSSLSNYGYIEREHEKTGDDIKAASVREEDPELSLEDEEAAAVQEQVKQIKAQEDEFETFNLKIVHRKNRHVLSII